MHVFYPGENLLTDDQDTVKIAAELARNHINSIDSILPYHELELVFSKTQVRTAVPLVCCKAVRAPYALCPSYF